MKKINYKLILLFGLITYIFIFSDVGIISKIRLHNRIRILENKLLSLEQKNRKLKIIIDKLNNDKNYLAEKAREIGYARKGEKIYRFYEEKPATNSSQLTNERPAGISFNFKDYYTYIIVFIVVLTIYILLIFYHRNSK